MPFNNSHLHPIPVLGILLILSPQGKPILLKGIVPSFLLQITVLQNNLVKRPHISGQITNTSQQRFTKDSRVLPTYIIKRHKSLSFQSPHHLPFPLIFSKLSIIKIFLTRASVPAMRSLDLVNSFRER